jgi:hypothetical protein
MKRAFLGVIFVSAAAFLGGCPMYSGGSSDNCNGNGCPVPGPYYDASFQCQSDLDCSPGYGCDSYGTCVWVGYDAGDCSTTGCPGGMICEIANGVAQCISLGGVDASPSPAVDAQTSDAQTGDAQTQMTTDAQAKDGGAAGDGGTDAAPTVVSCNSDSTCGGNGAKCIDGVCTSQGGLCSDTSQCVAAGAACVDGVCIPRCSQSAPQCPDGYTCDFNRNVCDNPSACTTASCAGGSVCVDQHCVVPCASSDAGPQCPSGLVCINGGCIPDQAAAFPCQNDGKSGQLANTCSSNQICLHHNCYDACEIEAGAGACASGVCKEVGVAAGTYAVCGTASTLGSQCDPATPGKACATGVCIDGYCVP